MGPRKRMSSGGEAGRSKRAKGKRPMGESSRAPVSAEEDYDDDVYVDLNAALSMRENGSMIRRNLVADRGIDSELLSMEFLGALVRFHGWQKFVHPKNYMAVPKLLILEFYANLAYGPSSYYASPNVYVRGKHITFSAENINSFLGTPTRDQCTYMEGLENPIASVDSIVEFICRPGTTWVPKHTLASIMVNRTDLTAEARTVFYFVVSSLLPVENHAKVYYRHMLLIYCILQRRPIDVGEIIRKNAYYTCREKKPNLPYPSLIYRLCRVEEVAGYAEQPIERCIAPLQYKEVAKFFRDCGRPVPPCPDSSRPTITIPPSRAAADSDSSSSAEELRTKRRQDLAAPQDHPLAGRDVAGPSQGPPPQRAKKKMDIKKTVQNLARCLKKWTKRMKQGCRARNSNTREMFRAMNIPEERLVLEEEPESSESLIAYADSSDSEPAGVRESVHSGATIRMPAGSLIPDPSGDHGGDTEILATGGSVTAPGFDAAAPHFGEFVADLGEETEVLSSDSDI